MPTRTDADDLLQRWDAQQTAYIRHRAARFDTIARIVALTTTGRTRPRILDLADGPGSLGLAVLGAVPNAELVIADKDPVLTTIARTVTNGDERIRVLECDLTDPAWTTLVGIGDEPFDAIISSTALHWLRPTELVDLYLQFPLLLVLDGIFLNGDHLHYDPATKPVLHGITVEDTERAEIDALTAGANDWDTWWEAALNAFPDAAGRW